MPLHKHEFAILNRQKIDWIFDAITILIIAIGAALYFTKASRLFMYAFIAYFLISFVRMAFLSARFVMLKGKQDGFFTQLKWWDPNKGFRLVSSIAFTILWINPKSNDVVVTFGLTIKQIVLIVFWLHTIWDFLDLKKYLFINSTGILYAGPKGSSQLRWEDIESINCANDRFAFITKVSYKDSVIHSIELRKADDAEWLKQELIQRADLHNIPVELATEPANAETTQST